MPVPPFARGCVFRNGPRRRRPLHDRNRLRCPARDPRRRSRGARAAGGPPMSPRPQYAPALALAALAATAACADRTVADDRPLASAQSTTTFTANQQLDLLFVVDDSNSMKREQEQ